MYDKEIFIEVSCELRCGENLTWLMVKVLFYADFFGIEPFQCLQVENNQIIVAEKFSIPSSNPISINC